MKSRSTSSARNPFHQILAAALLCFPGMAAADSVTRSQALATAAAYAEYRWLPSAANVLHGPDRAGIPVSTPDRSADNPELWQAGESAVGVPYKWGGFDTLESFERGIRAGKAGGDLYNMEKRRKGGAAVSSQAVGVDCSGFISRCWRLPKKHATSTLPGVCITLRSSALQPGDVLNQPNGHVVLFVKWLDVGQTRAQFYEAEPFSKVLSSERNVPELIAAGYVPLRYREMRD